MSNIDEQFVEYIVKSLVSNPDGVTIDRTIDEKGVLLKLTVDQEDLGRVIGKRGATAQSIRTLLRALGTKNDARYNLKIVDTGDGPPSKPSQSADTEEEEAEKPAKEEAADDAEEAEESDETEEKTDEKEDSDVDDVDSQPQEAVEEPEESLAERTRKELDDLDDLEI
ncbi:MAG: KH domain-containing protein [Candidatus Saccharimonadales bacterium]|nr:KH domain-containing protein [Candidatus Saccharimonadales bacterium]